MLGGIGMSLPLMMTERKIFVDTHLLCLSELRESSVDNHSKKHSFRFAFPIKWRSSVQFGLSATAVLSRFCCAAANLHVKRHFFQPSLLINACGCCLHGKNLLIVVWWLALFQLVCMTLISVACSQCPCAPNSFAYFYLALWLRLQVIHYALACHVWALLSVKRTRQTNYCYKRSLELWVLL